jgi:hypothetical protein
MIRRSNTFHSGLDDALSILGEVFPELGVSVIIDVQFSVAKSHLIQVLHSMVNGPELYCRDLADEKMLIVLEAPCVDEILIPSMSTGVVAQRYSCATIQVIVRVMHENANRPSLDPEPYGISL